MTADAEVWSKLPIGRISAPRLGGNYKNTNTVSARPLIKMANIARVRIDLSRLDYITDSEAVSPAHRLRHGDVLFNTRNTLDLVGKVSIWRDELPVAYYNSNILRLEFKPEYCGDSQYFGYVLNSAESVKAIRDLATGTTSVAAVYTRDLLRLEVPVPPRPEQRAIASALADADRLISALERLIAKKQAIKQGMMQELLTGKTRLPGFSEPWREGTFEQLATPSRERAMPQSVAGATPLVDLDQIEGGSGRLMSTSEASEALSLRAVFKPGDVLFGKLRAYLRKFWYADGDGLCTTEIWVLRAKAGVHGRFVRYIVETNQFIEVASGAYGTHMPRSDWGTVRALPVTIPPHDEQVAIASALGDVDTEIGLLHQRLSKARDVKQGMMQELLTGRTRLPVEEGAA